MFLPLFPLNTTLFPGERMPLHIFEPRYRQMIGECIEQEQPFGVVLIQSGPEVGGGAVPHRVGTTARIAEVERLDDGRLNIVTVGGSRFRIGETFEDRAYLTGEVDLLEDEEADSGPAHAAAQQARDLFLRFFQLTLAMRGEWTRRAASPTEPGRLADFLAARMPFTQQTRQSLLEELSVPRRLGSLNRFMESGIETLTPRVRDATGARYGGLSIRN